jgi:hypothetical protein
MTMKKITAILLLLTSVAASSCFKDAFTDCNSNYLKFSNASLHIANKQGAKGTVRVQSNISWQLAIEAPVPDWMTVNKLSGTNNDVLEVTATKDNITGGYKFANIIATPVNNTSLQPVRLTVVQYDSSYKGK